MPSPLGVTPPLIPASELREFAAPDYSISIFYLAFDWAVIVGAAWLGSQSWWAYPLACIVIGGRQHALFVLTHEGAHKHLAARKKLNDFIGSWLCAYPVMFDMHAYRATHLKHHEHLNSEQDPDWIRKRTRREWQFPVTKSKLALFVPYFLLLWGPVEWAMIIVLYSGIFRRETYISPQLRSWFVQKLIFYSAACAAITVFNLWTPVLLYWLVPLFFVFPAIQRVRSVAEHFALTWTSPLTATREILAGPIERSLFGPHHIHLHLTHHLYPAVPCYRLKALHKRLMEHPRFKSEAHLNSSYLGWGNSMLNDLLRARPISPVSTAAPEQISLSKAS
jgi:fatty acid desaturase